MTGSGFCSASRAGGANIRTVMEAFVRSAETTSLTNEMEMARSEPISQDTQRAAAQ